jgi:hypothetical protein
MTARRRIAALAALLLLAACSGGEPSDPDADAPRTGELVGTFGVAAGACAADGTRSGSFFRMVQPGGTLADGPFVSNADSLCADKTWTPLAPGSDGGLVTGAYQPQPEPAFAGSDGAAAAILQPTSFFAVKFAAATNDTDPQTGELAPPPRIVAAADGSLSGDLSAVGVAWNQQHFNQGAPKPGGGEAGITSGPSGAYDPDTGAYTLEWASQIVGGPFNNFTGVWRLEGAFAPEAAETPES